MTLAPRQKRPDDLTPYSLADSINPVGILLDESTVAATRQLHDLLMATLNRVDSQGMISLADFVSAALRQWERQGGKAQNKAQTSLLMGSVLGAMYAHLHPALDAPVSDLEQYMPKHRSNYNPTPEEIANARRIARQRLIADQLVAWRESLTRGEKDG